jgi:hypothetical protein
VQTDAEHQQHHADLGEFAGNLDVRDEPRGRRANQHPGQQIADQRRNSEPDGEEAEHESEAQTGGHGGYQRQPVVHQRAPCRGSETMGKTRESNNRAS